MPKNYAINQHYVPQGHLRLFANSKKRLSVYDKATDRIFGAAIRDVAAERYFNELLPDQLEHFQKGEAYFQTVEQMGLPVMHISLKRTLTNSVGNSEYVLSSKERTAMAYYIAVQMQRTRESREEARESLNKLGTHWARQLAPPPPAGFTVEQLISLRFKDDYVRFAHLQLVARQA